MSQTGSSFQRPGRNSLPKHLLSTPPPPSRERTQFVYSSSCCISCGVPQGSILHPLFFPLYITDVCQVFDPLDVILFADDTKLFFSRNDPDYLFKTINRELNRLSDLFKCSKLSINIKTSTFLLFRPRQK